MVPHLHDIWIIGLCRCQTVSDMVRHVNILLVACRLQCRKDVFAHSSVVTPRFAVSILLVIGRQAANPAHAFGAAAQTKIFSA